MKAIYPLNRRTWTKNSFILSRFTALTMPQNTALWVKYNKGGQPKLTGNHTGDGHITTKFQLTDCHYDRAKTYSVLCFWFISGQVELKYIVYVEYILSLSLEILLSIDSEYLNN